MIRVNAFGLHTASIANLAPDRKLWTLRLVGGDCDGLLADNAWTDPAGTRTHHWIKRGPIWPDEESVEVVETTVREYLLRPWRGMNPFWDIKRDEFMAEWKAHHLA
jgi:hypothetical protein